MLLAAMALHIVALASLHFGYLNPLFNDAENRLGQGSDFFAVYQAGHDFLHGISVYIPHQPNSGGDVPYAYAFRYLPSVAFSFGVVFNALPARPAYWGWVGFNEALLLVNVALTWRLAPTRATRVLGVAMWLLFTPLYVELFMGQFNFLMASLIFWLGLTLRSGQLSAATGSWTASLLAKTNSLILLPVAWRTGWLRLAVAGIVITALLNLPYFLVVGDSWGTWSGNFNFLGDRPDVVPHAGNFGLAALLALFRQSEGTGVLRGSVRLIGHVPWGIAMIVMSLFATYRASGRRLLPLLALWLCVYFFVFNDVWEHQYVLLLPGLVLLTLFDAELRPWVLAVYVLLALPTPYALFQTGAPRGVNYQFVDPQLYWSSVEVYVHHLSKLLPTVVLWTGCLWALTRSARAEAEADQREPAIAAGPSERTPAGAMARHHRRPHAVFWR